MESEKQPTAEELAAAEDLEAAEAAEGREAPKVEVDVNVEDAPEGSD